MLTDQEKKEINYHKLSPDLRLKIDTAFENPDMIVALAYSSQIKALANEMIENPFTIRGSVDSSIGTEGIDVEKEDAYARQRTETALKVLDKLDSLADKLRAIQSNLTPEQNDLINKPIVTAKELRNQAFAAQ